MNSADKFEFFASEKRRKGKPKDFLSELADKIDVVILKNIQKQLKLPGMSNWISKYYGRLLSLLMDEVPHNYERVFLEPEELVNNLEKLEMIKENLSLIMISCIGVAKTLKIDLHNSLVETLKRIEGDC
ncbi:MAG: hypothetical protein U9O96_01055 [Candidatus Thermoplasmatota archaeon]|nr:hypothetical protein [Candidatus Thermoplasmatota archaeon]